MVLAALKFHGGKQRLASRIVALMPPHLHFVEPYFGGGAVLLAKDHDGISEVVNDIDRNLTSFWKVLQDERTFARFQRTIEAVPFSEVEFNDSEEALGTLDPVGRAVAFFVRCRQSLAGRCKGFSGITKTRTRRRMNNEASAWLTAIDGLPDVHTRLRRVLILDARPALEVIRSQDGPNTLFYLDPPYLKETRTAPDVYAHDDMSSGDHEELLVTLSKIQGKFLLSGYPSQLYAHAQETYGWRLATFDMPNDAAGGEEKRRMTECIWMNY